ncbi:hypothetical protein CARUB_v10020022mg [Capsella rubella]|uniref:MBD domain-containing protein n=1 Tax=Capsella rubella TaxID=81985 RepID=R0GGF4_9BRAS|nr:uncharacterized protein LOC17895050 [Capsella rubella]EOA34937.1 hypothetical protein CARUB_v10020022mg [Capsella rubella]
MSRQLPPTITADATPDWLPVGWIVHSTVLRRGRQTKTYTQLRTGKKLSTKDQVLEYIRMEKIREKRETVIERKKANLKALQDIETAMERPPWLRDEREAEWGIGSVSGNPYKMNVNTPNETVPLDENSMECEESSGEEYNETGCNEITYVFDENEEDLSEGDYGENVENFSNISSTPLRTQPERMQKLESRAKTQCVFEDEEMSGDSDIKLIPDAETSKDENAWGEAPVVPNLVESFEEKNSHNAVVECDDKAREIPGLTGSLTVEINLDCEPGSDSLVEKYWNKSGSEGIGTRSIEIIDLESDLVHIFDSSKVVEVTQESGDISEEPLKAQAAHEPGDRSEEPRKAQAAHGPGDITEEPLKAQAAEKSGDKDEEPLKSQAAQEEPANEWRSSVFFPYREAPSHSVLVFDDSNARLSVEDLSNTIELGSNPPEKNISGSKKRKKNTETFLSKNIKEKGIKASTKKLQRGKTPASKPQGKKGSSSVNMDKKSYDWPEPCPNFPFEPLTRSSQVEDDSVIRRYLEQHFAAPGSADSNITLPDFGLPSFSNIKISVKEEPASKKKKSPDPPCVQVASSSLPSCSSMGTSMLQIVAGN